MLDQRSGLPPLRSQNKSSHSHITHFLKINYEEIKKEFKIFFRETAFTMIGSVISPFIIFSWIVFIQLSFAPYVHPGCPHPTLCPTGLARRIDRTGPACCGISKCLKKKDSLDVQLWKACHRALAVLQTACRRRGGDACLAQGSRSKNNLTAVHAWVTESTICAAMNNRQKCFSHLGRCTYVSTICILKNRNSCVAFSAPAHAHLHIT